MWQLRNFYFVPTCKRKAYLLLTHLIMRNESLEKLTGFLLNDKILTRFVFSYFLDVILLSTNEMKPPCGKKNGKNWYLTSYLLRV